MSSVKNTCQMDNSHLLQHRVVNYGVPNEHLSCILLIGISFWITDISKFNYQIVVIQFTDVSNSKWFSDISKSDYFLISEILITNIGKSFWFTISQNHPICVYRKFKLPISVNHFVLLISVNQLIYRYRKFDILISANEILKSIS